MRVALARYYTILFYAILSRIVLSHVRGQRSRARIQSCIFCNVAVRNPVVHCLGVCAHCATWRNDCNTAANLGPDAAAYIRTRSILCASPSAGDVFKCSVLFAAALEMTSDRFFQTKYVSLTLRARRYLLQVADVSPPLSLPLAFCCALCQNGQTKQTTDNNLQLGFLFGCALSSSFVSRKNTLLACEFAWSVPLERIPVVRCSHESSSRSA